MDTTTSPPLTPIRTYMMSPIDTSPSPTHSFREQLRRRTSSFSSNHDRSPATPRSRHRFSNASQLSADFGSPVGDVAGNAMGNLADELDQLDDDDDDFDEGETDNAHADAETDDADKDEASRDSGVDVSYRDSLKQHSPTHVRNFSKPFCGRDEQPPDEDSDEGEDRFTPQLEDLMSTIARMTSYTSTTEDPLIPRTITQLQDLGNQTSLEAAAQRYTTSTNSMSAYFTTQSKSLQTLAQTLYPMFAFSAPLDLDVVNEIIPLVEALQKDIPQPDMLPVQKLQKLDRETADVIHSLSQLTDTLQMGKQATTAAARHLRTTQTMVLELKGERDHAELARHELQKSDWEGRVKSRWYAAECKDIMSGFEDRCNTLRGSLEEAINDGA